MQSIAVRLICTLGVLLGYHAFIVSLIAMKLQLDWDTWEVLHWVPLWSAIFALIGTMMAMFVIAFRVSTAVMALIPVLGQGIVVYRWFESPEW